MADPAQKLTYSNGRLTPAGVEEIHRLRRVEKCTLRVIAERLGISRETVFGTVKGKTNPDLHPDRHPYGWAQA